MACSASVIDSRGVAGNLILASAIRNGLTSFPWKRVSRPDKYRGSKRFFALRIAASAASLYWQ